MATWENEFTTPGTSARVYLVLQVDLVSQDIATNTSTLNWYLRMEERVNANPYNNNGLSSANAYVNGALVYNSGGLSYNFDGTNETIYVASGTTYVTHNADGTMPSMGVSAAYSGAGVLGTASLSGTMALTTIPRATQPTVSPSSGNTGATYTITHTPATSSFYHDVAYSLDGGGSYTDIQTNIVGTDTSTDWTPAHTLLPNATGVTAIIRVITRASSGGTIIGTKTVNLPLTVPASVKPTVSSVAWVDDQTSSPNMPSLMGGAGRFVQRWSKLKPTATSAGASGSTVTGTQITQNGQTTPSGTAFGLPIALSGAVPYTAIATDSRSRTSDPYVNTVAVTAYNFPNLPTPAVQRTSDAGGTTPSPTGTYLRITPAASVSSLNFSGEKNLLEWQIRTRPSGGSWTTVQAWTAATVSGNTWTTPKVIAGYSAATEYEVEVSVRDLFGKNGFDTANTVKTLTVIVPTESVFMDYDGNDGVGIGEYRRSGAMLSVAGQIKQRAGKRVLDEDDITGPIAADIATAFNSARSYIGTVDSLWTYGKPNVTISGVGVVSALLPPTDIDIQPGATVVLTQSGGSWYIEGAYAAAPTYLRQIPLTLNTAGGWGQYDDLGAVPNTFYNADPASRYGPATVTKSASGWVLVTGLIYKGTATGATPILIATLPVGFRPSFEVMFPILNNSETVTYNVLVKPNGEIWTTSSGLVAGYISLNSIQFNHTPSTTNLTMANSWVAFGGSAGTPRVADDGMGLGFLSGAMMSGSIVNGTSFAAQVAAGVRPVANNYLYGAGTLVFSGRFHGASAGPQIYTPLPANTRYDLEPMMWSIAANAPTYYEVPYLNSWANYLTGYHNLSFAKRPDGLVHVRGFVKSGTIGSPMARLPEGFRPPHHLIFSTISVDSSAALGINSTGDIVARSGSNGWFSVNALFAPGR